MYEFQNVSVKFINTATDIITIEPNITRCRT